MVLDLIRWGFGGFLLGLAGAGNRIGLDQLNFVMVSSSFALPCFAGASIEKSQEAEVSSKQSRDFREQIEKES